MLDPAPDVRTAILDLLVERGWDPARLRWLIALLCEVEEAWRAEIAAREAAAAATFWTAMGGG